MIRGGSPKNSDNVTFNSTRPKSGELFELFPLRMWSITTKEMMIGNRICRAEATNTRIELIAMSDL